MKSQSFYASRNLDIYLDREHGATYTELAKKYNLSRERVRQIVQKETNKQAMIAKRKTTKKLLDQGVLSYTFLDALIEVASKESDIPTNMEVRTYNCLSRSGILNTLKDGQKTLDDYDDETLLSIRGFGVGCLRVSRKANELWLSHINKIV